MGPGHAAQQQKTEQSIDDVESEIYQVLRPRTLTKELAIEHVREPG
jgi:hypothetical protein